jgi:signal transduction histidine kinase
MVGLLVVDYAEEDHDYTSQEELMLIETMARLGALVLERDRLLRRWAEARANVLALRTVKEQMDTFLGIASHELKGPLTALKLSLQMTERRLHKAAWDLEAVAAERYPTLQPALEQHRRTVDQVARLERLVNDLVDVSRIQAGKLELRLERADLVAILRDAVEEQQVAAPERTISLQCPADLQIPVSVDSGRIEQVMANYLTNALKYSPEDRPIAVGLQVEEQRARVWVRDEGPGLPVEVQERIWERFHRVPGIEVQSGTGVGLGLGLYICRTIVERHQGQVGVESTPGQGSTFWFSLPLVPTDLNC